MARTMYRVAGCPTESLDQQKRVGHFLRPGRDTDRSFQTSWTRAYRVHSSNGFSFGQRMQVKEVDEERVFGLCLTIPTYSPLRSVLRKPRSRPSREAKTRCVFEKRGADAIENVDLYSRRFDEVPRARSTKGSFLIAFVTPPPCAPMNR